jgi:hypothetical protein
MTMHCTANHGAVVGCHLFLLRLVITYGKSPNARRKISVSGLGDVVGLSFPPPVLPPLPLIADAKGSKDDAVVEVSSPGSRLELPKLPNKLDEGAGAEAGF